MQNEQVELEDFKKPKRNFKIFWAILLTVIVMGAGGTYGYFYLSNESQSQKDELINKIEELQSQVNDLTGTITTDNSLDGLSDEPLDPNLTTKEFVSSRLGLTIRYPKSYYASEIGNGDNTYLIVDKKAIDSTIPANSEFPQQYFMISKNSELCSQNSVKNMAIDERVTDAKIAGKNGWKFTMTKPSDLDGSFSTNFFFNNETACYHISVRNSDGKGTHDSTVDEIISSITLSK